MAQREKPTQYRTVWEFTLRYPEDYHDIRESLQNFTQKLEEHFAIQNDFASIEKRRENEPWSG